MARAKLSSNILNSIDGPFAVQCIASGAALLSRVDDLAAGDPVFKIDVRGCTNEISFFNAVMTGLCLDYRLPNWSAYDDVMFDVPHIAEGRILVVVLNGTSLYRSAPHLFHSLASSLERIGADCAKGHSEGAAWDRPAKPFHALFSSDRKSDLPLPIFDINS